MRDLITTTVVMGTLSGLYAGALTHGGGWWIPLAILLLLLVVGYFITIRRK